MTGAIRLDSRKTLFRGMRMDKTERRFAISRGARAAIAGISLGALLLSCSNMLTGNDLKAKIGTDVTEANATSVKITINTNPSSSIVGTVSPAVGPQTEKVGVPFALTANQNEAYVFIGWTATGSGKVAFSAASSAATSATIGNDASDIVITANFTARPAVNSIDPYFNSTVGINKTIKVLFSKTLDINTLILANLTVTAVNSGDFGTVAPTDITDRFSISPIVLAGATLPSGISLPLKASQTLGIAQRIDVTIKKAICDAAGNPMQNDYTFFFLTGNTIVNLPIMQNVSVSRDGTNDIGSSNGYNAYPIYAKAAANIDSAAGQTLTKIRFILTDVDAGWAPIGSPETVEYPFNSGYNAFTPLGAHPEGRKTLEIQVKDNYDQWSALNPTGDLKQLFYDTTRPSMTTFSLAGGAAYAPSSTGVTLFATDGSGCGVSAYQVKVGSAPVDGDGWTTGWDGNTITPSINLGSGDGAKTVYYRVKDAAGNISSGSAGIILDATPPNVTTFAVATSSLVGGTLYTKLAANAATLAANDGSGSGLSAYQVKVGSAPVDGDGWTTGWDGSSITPSINLGGGDGSKTVYYRVKDAAGNISNGSCVIKLDATPPSMTTFKATTSSLVGGTLYTKLSANAATMIANDGSGCGVSAYQIKVGSAPVDGDGWTTGWDGSSIAPTINLGSVDGQVTVYYRVEDALGTTSSGSCDVSLDTTPPDVTTFKVTTSSLVGSTLYTKLAANTATLAANDGSGCGLSAYQVKVGSAPVDGDGWTTGWDGSSIAPTINLGSVDGSKTVYYRVKDALGSISGGSCAIALDTTPPLDVGSQNAVDAGNQRVKLTWTEPAAIDYKQVNITWGGGSATVLKGTTTYTTEALAAGAYTFRFKTQDVLGNIQSSGLTKSFTVVAVGTAPDPVTGLTATAAAPAGAVKISWTNPIAGVASAGVIIGWSDGNGVQSSYTYTADLTAGAAESWTTPVLNSAATYSFKVATVSAGGDVSSCLSASATPAASTILITGFEVAQDGANPKLGINSNVSAYTDMAICFWSGDAFPPPALPSSIPYSGQGSGSAGTLASVTWGSSFSFYLIDTASGAASATYTVTYNDGSYNAGTLYARSLRTPSAQSGAAARSKPSFTRGSYFPASAPIAGAAAAPGTATLPGGAAGGSGIDLKPIEVRYVAPATTKANSVDASGLSIFGRPSPATAEADAPAKGSTRAVAATLRYAEAPAGAPASGAAPSSAAASAAASGPARSGASAPATEPQPARNGPPVPRPAPSQGMDLYVNQSTAKREESADSWDEDE
jgi:hypothetical protein